MKRFWIDRSMRKNLLCSRDWNQEDVRAIFFLEVPGPLPAEQQIPTKQMVLTLEMRRTTRRLIEHIYTPTAQRKILLEMGAVACLSGPQRDTQLATQMLQAENAQISKQKPQNYRLQ